MRTYLPRLAMVAAVAALTAACSFESSGANDNAGERSQAGEATVSITNNEFTPSTLEIDAGETVTWTWDQGTHNVVFADEESDVKGDGTWSRSFDEPGSFDYQCTLHSGMTGTVVVS